MRASGARAIFAEAQFNDDLVQAIAADAGATVVRDLYDDTLGDPPADTYAGMMRWNADRVTRGAQPLGQGGLELVARRHALPSAARG